MQSEGARTVCIVRRMKRKSLGALPWNAYDPTKAQPEELRFDILDDRDRISGQIAFDKFSIRFMKIGQSVLRTPWGEGTIGWKDGWCMTLRGRELFVLCEPTLKKSIQLRSPMGLILTFRIVGRRRNDIEYADDMGFISVTEEDGQLSAPPPGRPLTLTAQELKALPKNQRPRSVESLNYVQYRIRAAGVLPAPQEDLVAALAMFGSFGRLIEEIPS